MFFNTKPQLSKDVSKNIFFQIFLEKRVKVRVLLQKRCESFFHQVLQKTNKVKPGKGTSFLQKTNFNKHKHTYPCRIKKILENTQKLRKSSTFGPQMRMHEITDLDSLRNASASKFQKVCF